MGLNHRAALSNITNFKREAFGKHASQSILEDSLLVRLGKNGVEEEKDIEGLRLLTILGLSESYMMR
ncbi:hypothetical protein ABKV19_006275 [Rosa sericea]